jgi:hypothetical protein
LVSEYGTVADPDAPLRTDRLIGITLHRRDRRPTPRSVVFRGAPIATGGLAVRER